MGKELTVSINQTDLSIKEYQGQRVVTMKEIDAVHERPEGTARKRLNDNKKHFVDEVDCFTITQPSEIRTLGIERPQGGTPDSITLITETGYLMLVKSFTDDLAWKVQRELVNTYFCTKTRRADKPAPKPKLGEYNAAARIISKTLKDAGMAPEFVALAVKNVYEPTGISIPLDTLTTEKKSYDATQIAKQLKVFSKSGKPHNQAIGAVAAKIGISDEHVVIVPFQNQASGHSGPTVQYDDVAVAQIRKWFEASGFPSSIEHGCKHYTVYYGG